jgi:hypothetical protein
MPYPFSLGKCPIKAGIPQTEHHAQDRCENALPAGTTGGERESDQPGGQDIARPGLGGTISNGDAKQQPWASRKDVEI